MTESTQPNRHEHADILIAIANGETIQAHYKSDTENHDWFDLAANRVLYEITKGGPNWKFRVKPKQQIGWMNIYAHSGPEPEGGFIFPSEIKAKEQRDTSRTCVACVQVNWTEGEGL